MIFSGTWKVLGANLGESVLILSAATTVEGPVAEAAVAGCFTVVVE